MRIALVVTLACFVALVSCSDLGSGVKQVRYDGSSAIIEVDNYFFKDGTELGMKELCGQILEAAKNKQIEKVYVKAKVQGEDKYGKEMTQIHYDTVASGRADLDEIAKYETGEALFTDLGTGIAMKYEGIIMQDNNIIH